jgi:hypothetical protein
MAVTTTTRTGPTTAAIDPVPQPPDPKTAWANLDSGLPLALFPVRLETRFIDGEQYDELQIRIYPDAFHLNTFQRDLTQGEIELGRTFWRRMWRASTDRDRALAIWSWFVGKLGPWRAAWVARSLIPTNSSQSPTAPLAEEAPLPVQPLFPALTPRTTDSAAKAQLLPYRWVAVGYRGGTRVFEAWSRPIVQPLALGVDPSSTHWDTAPVNGELSPDPEAAWLSDFTAALDKGMALSVPLNTALTSGITQPGQKLDELFVLGVASNVTDGADQLASALEALHYTRGVGFVPHGTPTNNSEEASAGLTPGSPDLASLMDREIGSKTRAGQPPAIPAGSNAERTAEMLGLSTPALLQRLPHGLENEHREARDMNSALWPASLRALFSSMLVSQDGTRAVLSAAARQSLYDWFRMRVRGNGPLPCLHLSHEPFGVLPACRMTSRTTDAAGVAAQLERVVYRLRTEWRSALSSVPRVEPTSSGGMTTAEAEEALVAVLSSQPHPWQYTVRRLEDKGDSDRLGYSLLQDYVQLVDDENGDQMPGIREVNTRLKSYVSSATTISQQISYFDQLMTLCDTEVSEGNTRISEIDTTGRNNVSTLEGYGWVNPGGLWYLIDWTNQSTSTIPFMYRPAAQALFNQNAVLAAERANLVSQKEILLGDDGDHGIKWLFSLEKTAMESHRERSQPLTWFSLPSSTFDGRMGIDDPALAYGVFDDTSSTWKAPLVQADGATSGGLASSYLAWLATADPATVRTQTPTGMSSPAPLLFQLLREGLALLAGTTGSVLTNFRTACQNLAAVPADTLELRMRETLGLATHRLDAWATSLATERLETLRTQRATGLLIGGYGFVENLRADSAQLDSEGYVLAPSLAHATTAAILRSGWSAIGAPELAVDLQSSRVRTAKWLLDGVRQGRSLGELLGARLERDLHERNLDKWISTFRTAVDSTGSRRVVDGVALLEKFDAGGLDPLLAGQPDEAQLRTQVFPALADALDAVGDVGLSEAVHQLAQGNLARAGAAMDMLGEAATRAPELDLPVTPRPGVSITHRLLVLLPESSALTSWAATPRSIAAPRLEHWAASALGGDATRVQLTASWLAEDGATSLGTETVTIADLGISALDAIYAAPAGADGAGSELEARVGAWLASRRPASVPATARVRLVLEDEPVAGPALTGSEFTALAATLRRLFGSARAADARDLALPGSTDAAGTDTDASELASRARDVAKFHTAAVTDLAALLPADDTSAVDDEAIRTALLALANLGLAGAATAETDDTALLAHARQVAELASTREQAVTAALADLDAAASPTASLAAATTVLSTILGSGFPVLASFRMTDPATLDASFGRSGARPNDTPTAASSWLAQAARVRTGAERLNDALLLADACSGASIPKLHVGQLPDNATDPWAALSAPPASTGGRISLVAVIADTPNCTGALQGLVVDEWTEVIPRDEQPGAIAFHFDAPTSQAPQAVLLAVPPTGEEWSFDVITNTVRETFEWARLRAVGPETLTTVGQYLPAVLSDAALSPGT